MVGRYVRDESEMSPTTFIFLEKYDIFHPFPELFPKDSRTNPEPTPNQRHRKTKHFPYLRQIAPIPCPYTENFVSLQAQNKSAINRDNTRYKPGQHPLKTGRAPATNREDTRYRQWRCPFTKGENHIGTRRENRSHRRTGA